MLRAALRAADGCDAVAVIESEHLDGWPNAGESAEPSGSHAAPMGGALSERVDAFQARLIQSALADAGGNWADAARRLGVDRGNLHRLAKRLRMK